MTTLAASPDTLIDALRRNMDLLTELAVRYDVETMPTRGASLPSISSPDDVRRLVGPEMSRLAQEQVRVLLLDRKNRVVSQRVIYQGNCYSAIIRPSEVFRPAVMEAVPHVIVAHNHPSCDPSPSAEDVSVTRELVEAARLLRIEMLDHVVIGGDGAASLRDRGLMSG